MRRLAFAAVLAVSSAGVAAEMKLEKKPYVEPVLVKGASTADPPALVAWLQSLRPDGGKQATVRLPIALQRTGPNGVGKAELVTRSKESLALKVEDYRLGVSLAERYRQHFKDAQKGALWLSGTWEGEGRFAVSRVIGPVAEGTDVLFAQLEAPPP